MIKRENFFFASKINKFLLLWWNFWSGSTSITVFYMLIRTLSVFSNSLQEKFLFPELWLLHVYEYISGEEGINVRDGCANKSKKYLNCICGLFVFYLYFYRGNH